MGSSNLVVSVSELKARLSEHLRKVKGGQRLTITERGRPIAMMGPLPADRIDDDARALVEAGLMRPGRNRLTARFWSEELPDDPEDSVLSALLEERQEGR